MTEIALAYSSIDKQRAEAIGRVLGALGYKLSPQPLTAASVDAAGALVVFWSSGSVNSIPINQLASQASCDKKLVCVRAGHADPPAAYALVALHDLSRWTGSLDAPELRTFLQHLLRMAPPANAPFQAPAAQQGGVAARAPTSAPRSVAAGNAPQQQPFAFAGPIGAAARPGETPFAFAPPPASAQAPPRPLVREAPAPMEQPRPRRQIGLAAEPTGASFAAAPPALAPEPAPAIVPPAAPRRTERPDRPEDRPAVRRAAERRRASGGGVARVAFGAIAVSVIAGAAVAAFNYDPDQQRAAATPDSEGAGANAGVWVTPNTISAAAPAAADPNADVPLGGTETDAMQVAAAAPLPAAPVATPDAAATLQSNRGWTASLPSGPVVGSRPAARLGPTATPVSAGAPPPARSATRVNGLTAVDAPPLPAPTDLVAIDGANLKDAASAPRPLSVEEERALIRKSGDYGPTP
ncbi:MAG: hypothetical protein NW200_01945 [Hyphomonadaceae bacterium]|nr:hypothetical protein [Hyphomonadaceae bacterium]